MTGPGPLLGAPKRATPPVPAARSPVACAKCDDPASVADSPTPPGVRHLWADGLASALALAVSMRSSESPPGTSSLAGTQPLARSAARTLATPATAETAPAPAYTHQTQNPALLQTIYPHRERALRKFVAMYREIELRDYTAKADRERVVEGVVTAIDREIERLKRDPATATTAAKEIKALEQRRTRDQRMGDRAWEDAVAWESTRGVDPLAGEELAAEVDRLIATDAVPKWVGPMVRDYAGMRYKSGHGSYFSPVRLVYAIEQARGAWTKSRADEDAQRAAGYEREKSEWSAKDKKLRGHEPREPSAVRFSAAERAVMHLSPAEAAARVERMHLAGEIPAWAWHEVVRLTELRTRYAVQGWEKTKVAEKPGSTPDDKLWQGIMHAWRQDSPIAGSDFNPGHGSTGWRTELNRRNLLITTRMVCNELSEAAHRHRGIALSGGISGDVKDYEAAQDKQVSGAYYKQLSSLDDLRTGATLFFVNRDSWRTVGDDGGVPNHTLVRAVPGGTYPMPTPPEQAELWAAWKGGPKRYKQKLKAWEKRRAKGKRVGPRPEPFVGPEPKRDAPDHVPGNGAVLAGWLYTVVPGQPITRSKDGVTHYLGWKHQAQVLRVWPDGRVFTLETTVETVPTTDPDAAAVDGPDETEADGEAEAEAEPAAETEASAGTKRTKKKTKTIEYSGFREHQLKEMLGHTFVGYLPGNDVPQPAPPADDADTPATAAAAAP